LVGDQPFGEGGQPVFGVPAGGVCGVAVLPGGGELVA